jgi:hypothetical protein
MVLSLPVAVGEQMAQARGMQSTLGAVVSAGGEER